ncbi:MAG TPA: alpha/beta hydrolase [Anaerolineales bacterium]|nr:alpha/beta hydrolase [Anaerolineales bacterium]
MSTLQAKSGFLNVSNARIYYEMAGQGTPFVMIHAGVADSRQWNNEFEFFARKYQVVRYDMRGYGKSEPVEGEFNHLEDVVGVLNALGVQEPVVIMGCSMGGGIAMDFALTNPSKVSALIMVGSAPSGLELDVPTPAKFADAEKAFEAGDLDLVGEIETQIWFDGSGRTPDQVNQAMRKLVYGMNRQALAHEVKNLGKRLPNTQTPVFDRLGDLKIPVLIVVGRHDTPYILAAADYMVERIPSAKKVVIEDAAHLPNLDHPDEFQAHVENFLESLSREKESGDD